MLGTDTDSFSFAPHRTAVRRMPVTDRGASLMKRVQTGDVEAFEKLWDAYGRLVYSTALKVLGRCNNAEDVTQMVFLKIWAKPGAFRGDSFAGWVSRVTRNLAIDELRRGAGATFVEFDPQARCESVLSDVVFARLDAQQLRENLREVSQQNRWLIELNFFEGKTHEEIAAMTQIPLGTVKTRIRAGIGSLRAMLREAAC